MYLIQLLLFLSSVYGVMLQCNVTQAQTILEGCVNLSGLNVIGARGDAVGDTNCGKRVPIADFLLEPTFQYPLADSAKLYTILIIDPDAPLGPFFIHLLKSNIPGSALRIKGGSKTAGVTTIFYLPPTPLPPSSLHRYFCLVYEQTDGNVPYPPVSSQLRALFNLDAFIQDNKNLCGPVASTMFRCRLSLLGGGSVVFGSSLQCSVTEVKSLLEGCDRLIGLNVTAVGGTIVDDHNCDVLLPKQVFFDEPLFQYSLADSKKFYTLIMADPDAPPQLDGEFFVHMLKSNIPGLALKAKESVKTVGVDYRPYKPPTPPHGSGAHRYISLLYEQADGNNFLPNVPPSRNRFALADWLRGKNLCGPVAATMFRTQY